MTFPGVWMTESQSVVYRVLPKCACSTIGQIIYYTDHGSFFDGDIHDATEGIHKWQNENSRPLITAAVNERSVLAFTCVRNPYTRVLSSFFDKICGIQRNGTRYRENLVPLVKAKYGIETGKIETNFEFDQIKSFRRFLLFARDTIRWQQPMAPDIHWSSISGHMYTFVANGGRFDQIFSTEQFTQGMGKVLASFQDKAKHTVKLDQVPRFNESKGHGPKRAHAVEDFFDDLSMHLMWEIYRSDFELFKYDFANPANQLPIAEIELDEVHTKLSQ